MKRWSVKRLTEKLDIRLWPRIPVIHQTESSECGPACLAMIAAHYGKNIDLVSLRRQFNFPARGTSLAGLTGIAAGLGMSTRALSLDMDDLPDLRLPCVLHWDFNHFVVLVRVRKNRCILHDPACGRRVISRSELARHFTGVALEIWPDSHFTRQKAAGKLSLRRLVGHIHGLKGALLKIFAFSVVIETIGLIMPAGTQLVMDHAIPAGDSGLLSLIVTGLLFFILLQAAVSLCRAWASLVMETLISVQWQSGLFSHLLRLPLSYFERRKLGDIQSRFASLDILRSVFTTSIVGAIMDSIMLIGVLTMMILYGGHLTLIVLGFTAAYILMRLATYHYYRQLSEESLIKEARAGSYFMESMYGIATIKTQGMTGRRGSHWLNLKVDAVNTGIRLTRMNLLFGGVNTFIMACDQVVILWVGAGLVIDNVMTLGMFVAFGAYRDQFSRRAASVTEFLLRLRMMSLHNERISDIALHEPENKKPDLPYEPQMRAATLEARGLTFRYDSQSPPVFQDLTLNLRAGECVAIAGHSGSGKTTLMKVLCGLSEPSAGQVLIDGTDIRQLGVNNYHKMVACVMQDDRLFSGSVRDNICGFTDAPDDTLMTACAQMAFIHEAVMQMPMGYETLIGELGEGLSGGQKQRLFIARALYRQPRILFMDEATSALDTESEARVNAAVSRLPVTRVIIAHRESTLQSADRVIYLK